MVRHGVRRHQDFATTNTRTYRGSDATSGVQWVEWTAAVRQAAPDAFLNKCLGSPPVRKSSCESAGADTLVEISIRSFLNNLSDVDDSSLVGVPSRLLGLIWDKIKKNHLDSLRLWQMFAKAFHDDGEEIPESLHNTTTADTSSLSLAIPRINSPDVCWLTSLTLVNTISSPSTTLPQLATMSNLVSLHIKGDANDTAETCMINDDSIRHWGKQARHSGGFPRLKWLFLRHQVGVTEASLEHLVAFPVLDQVVTSQCGVRIVNAMTVVQDRGFHATDKEFWGYTYWQSGPRNWFTLVDEYIKDNHTILTQAPVSPPLVTPDRLRWLVADVKGKRQGPYSGIDMDYWYKARIFTPEVQVKKLEDPDYEPMGQLMKRLGDNIAPFLKRQVGVKHESSPWYDWKPEATDAPKAPAAPIIAAHPNLPLSHIQFGRAPNISSSHILNDPNEVQCWVRSTTSRVQAESTRKHEAKLKRKQLRINGKRHDEILNAKKRACSELMDDICNPENQGAEERAKQRSEKFRKKEDEEERQRVFREHPELEDELTKRWRRKKMRN